MSFVVHGPFSTPEELVNSVQSEFNNQGSYEFQFIKGTSDPLKPYYGYTYRVAIGTSTHEKTDAGTLTDVATELSLFFATGSPKGYGIFPVFNDGRLERYIGFASKV